MSSTIIKLKRSEVADRTPTANDLAVGEIAINTADQKIYTKDSNNNIIEVANNVSNILLSNNNISDGSKLFSTTNSNQTLDSFSSTDYRTAKYIIQSICSGEVHSLELLVTHDDATVFKSQSNSIYSSSALISVDATISAGDLKILVTPASADTRVDFQRTAIISRSIGVSDSTVESTTDSSGFIDGEISTVDSTSTSTIDSTVASTIDSTVTSTIDSTVASTIDSTISTFDNTNLTFDNTNLTFDNTSITFDAGDYTVTSTIDSTVDSTIDSTIDSTVTSSIDSTVASTIDSTIDSTVASTIDSTIDSTVDSTVTSTIDSTVDSTIDSTVTSTIDSTVDSTVTSTIDSTVTSTVDSTIDSTVASTIDSTIDSTVDSTVPVQAQRFESGTDFSASAYNFPNSRLYVSTTTPYNTELGTRIEALQPADTIQIEWEDVLANTGTAEFTVSSASTYDFITEEYIVEGSLSPYSSPDDNPTIKAITI